MVEITGVIVRDIQTRRHLHAPGTRTWYSNLGTLCARAVRSLRGYSMGDEGSLKNVWHTIVDQFVFFIVHLLRSLILRVSCFMGGRVGRFLTLPRCCLVIHGTGAVGPSLLRARRPAIELSGPEPPTTPFPNALMPPLSRFVSVGEYPTLIIISRCLCFPTDPVRAWIERGEPLVPSPYLLRSSRVPCARLFGDFRPTDVPCET